MTAPLTIAAIAQRVARSRRPAAVPTYRSGEGQRCPGCTRRAWIIRSATAECAFCATALPLASTAVNGACSAPEGDV